MMRNTIHKKVIDYLKENSVLSKDYNIHTCACTTVYNEECRAT